LERVFIVIFRETKIAGAFLIEPERREDDRGFFARTFCRDEFTAHGLNPAVVQCNTSFNRRKGTLRGMHYQVQPFAEAKLVRCTAGAIFDAIIDLRESSSTFTHHFTTELAASSGAMLYVPEGCAHGFQTLVDNTEVFYQMSQQYAPECARGLRWNDPFFGIQWPDDRRTILGRDRTYPDFSLEGIGVGS
jgi:dTDP-4-dehydrorhamnose 3,5-epimerase